MAKKPAKTFHLLQMADSLKEQNQAIGLLLMRIETAKGLAEVTNEDGLRKLLADIADEAAKTQAAVWPQEL